METKYIVVLIIGVIIGVITGYIFCSIINKKNIFKDVTITHPACY